MNLTIIKLPEGETATQATSINIGAGIAELGFTSNAKDVLDGQIRAGNQRHIGFWPARTAAITLSALPVKVRQFNHCCCKATERKG